MLIPNTKHLNIRAPLSYWAEIVVLVITITSHIHMTEVNYIFTEARHNYMDISVSVRRMHAAAIDRPR